MKPANQLEIPMPDASPASFARAEVLARQRTFDVAQGYLTALLQARGIHHALINIGEYRALGTRPDGSPWRIGIASPDPKAKPIDVISLTNRAMATSGGYGFQFDPTGRYHHLLSPKTGRSPSAPQRSVSVEAPTAIWADGLATTGCVLPWPAFAALLAQVPDTRFRIYRGNTLEHDTRRLEEVPPTP